MIHEAVRKGVKCSSIIFGIIGLFVSCVHAQSLDIGARVGMNLAYYENVNFAGDMPRAPAAGFIEGIQSDYWIKPSWALSGQILYVQSKTERSYSAGIPQSGMTGQRSVYTENFLEIPVEIKLRFTIDHDLQTYIFAGGTTDFLLTAFKTIYSGAGMQSANQDYTTFESSRPIFGAMGGLGINLNFIPKVTMFIEGDYRLGLISSDFHTSDLRFFLGTLFQIF